MNAGIQGGAWSRYVFPWTCEHFAHLGSTLYIRHGNDVSYVIEEATNDDGVAFDGVIQWPWLDFGQPGVNKMMHGFDIVGTGVSSIEVGYDQTNFDTFTTAYNIPADTYPGLMIPLPVTAPSLCVKLTYSDRDTDNNFLLESGDNLLFDTPSDILLLESGDELLLESGSGGLLLENDSNVDEGDALLVENDSGQTWQWKAFNLYLQDQRVNS
jgi:hypothetical protein